MGKAQIQQVFIYMMAILVIGFLLLFGYRAIDRLMGQKCMVEQAEFSTGLVRNIDQTMRFNSVTQARVQAPCDYDTLCVVDARSVIDDMSTVWMVDNPLADYPIIAADVADGIQNNLYLIDGKTVTAIGFDERIRISPDADISDDPLLCVEKRSGVFSFIIKGQGNAVILSADG
jgi:hypothetical protein